MKKYLCVYILSELYIFFAFMHLSAAIPGVDPRDIRGNSTGCANFCPQFSARDGGIEPLLHFRGKIHRERPAVFITLQPFENERSGPSSSPWDSEDALRPIKLDNIFFGTMKVKK